MVTMSVQTQVQLATNKTNNDQLIITMMLSNMPQSTHNMRGLSLINMAGKQVPLMLIEAYADGFARTLDDAAETLNDLANDKNVKFYMFTNKHNQTVGMCSLKCCGGSVWLRDLVIIKSMRNRGYAQGFIARLYRRHVHNKSDVHNMLLRVRGWNYQAQNLYTKLGFVVV